MARGYGPPPVDAFGMISSLGTSFEGGFDRARKRQEEELQRAAQAETANLYLAGSQPAAAPMQSLSALGAVPAPIARPSMLPGGSTAAKQMPVDPTLAPSIVKHATAAGLNPVDVATAMSYETAGTFDPWKAGPTTQWGQHRGLIQWGEPQAKQYGVGPDTPVETQVAAAVKYLQDRGVKPGMGLMDIYSAINAGSVGRNNASDANNGGAPGTVADKVNGQMAAHRQKAAALLGGAAPSPEADLPAQGAVEAQGFAIPGASAQAAPAQAGANLPPQVRAMLQSANPRVRQQGIALAQKALEPVAGVNVNGRLVNPRTGVVIADMSDTNKPPEEVQRYEYAKRQGYQGSFMDFQTATRKAGATNVSVGTPGAEPEFDKEMAKGAAKQWLEMAESGQAAQSRMVDLTTLREMSRVVGEQGSTAALKERFGPYLEAAGIKVDGLDAIQAYQSTVAKVVPTLRTPGSGTTSDRDLAQFEKSVGSLSANPAAREMALDVLMTETQNQAARGDIAVRLRDKEITPQQARQELAALPKALDIYREFRRQNPTAIRDALQGKGAATAPTKLPEGYTPDRAKAEAKNAIANGKPREAVIQRLQSLGVDTSGL